MSQRVRAGRLELDGHNISQQKTRNKSAPEPQTLGACFKVHFLQTTELTAEQPMIKFWTTTPGASAR